MKKIELRVPGVQWVNGIGIDPEPDKTFEQLLEELKSIEENQKIIDFPSPSTRNASKDKESSPAIKAPEGKRFVMHASSYETESGSGGEGSPSTMKAPKSKGFVMHISSDDETGSGTHEYGGSKDKGFVMRVSDGDESDIGNGGGIPHDSGSGGGGIPLLMQSEELTHELPVWVTDEVRSRLSLLDRELVHEHDRLASLTTAVDRYRESQQEAYKNFDLQYRHTMAESLDTYLKAVRMEHEHASQLEETGIQEARLEAEMAERAIIEAGKRVAVHDAGKDSESLDQLKERGIQEARLEAKMAERAIIETGKKVAVHDAGKDSESLGHFGSTVKSTIIASENALQLEKRRQQIYEELFTEHSGLHESANENYDRLGHVIVRQIKILSATKENMRTRVQELTYLIDSAKSSGIKIFAEKIISICTNQSTAKTIFATSRVIVLVTSQIPVAMDILLRELNKRCIYTVPKHVMYSVEAFETKSHYYTALGYKEDNGEIESEEHYLQRLKCCMRLYGALVQVEVEGHRSLHGIAEGWAWLARFLNMLPATTATAIALHSFLEMAGYALWCKYKNQFEKLVNIVDQHFLVALEDGAEANNAELVKVKEFSACTYKQTNTRENRKGSSKLFSIQNAL